MQLHTDTRKETELRHIFTGNQPYLSYPRVMGHELSGVVETAPADSVLQTGDTVYVRAEVVGLEAGVNPKYGQLTDRKSGV